MSDGDPRAGHRTRTQGQRVLTAVEIESEIVALSDAMEETLGDYATLADEAAAAEHAYKVKKSKETLTASTKPGNGREGRTTVDERDAMVMVACDAEFLAHLIAEARFAAAKETLRVQQNRMDGLRTIAANIRAQT